MSSESKEKRAAAERMAKRIHESAKQNGGTMTFEQAQKLSASAFKRNERDGK
tara:strand:+ start:243 stop:398 length:156 start_codon:yes stop_codon:yes gene_type:complete